MKIKYLLSLALGLLVLVSCKHEHGGDRTDDLHDALHFEEDSGEVKASISQLKDELIEAGFEIFDYVDPKTSDTIIMQKYFMAFLKEGPNRNQIKSVADSLQTEHLAHLAKMYEQGYADISGPFGDDGEIKGVTVYNVPNFEMADSLANMDPMVKSGRLIIEIHPWWAAKGFPLR